jgi:hypothetical protein
MKKINKLITFFIFASLSAASPVSAFDMQDGMWEITTKIEMKGMPEMPGAQEFKHTMCMTKDNAVPGGQNARMQDSCKILKQNISGNTVNYAVQCKDNNTDVFTEGKITYNKTVFSGESATTINDPNQGKMQMHHKMSGKRIGDCQK